RRAAHRAGGCRTARHHRAKPGHLGRKIEAVAAAVVGQVDRHRRDIDAAKGQHIAGRSFHLRRGGGKGRRQGQHGHEGKSGLKQWTRVSPNQGRLEIAGRAWPMQGARGGLSPLAWTAAHLLSKDAPDLTNNRGPSRNSPPRRTFTQTGYLPNGTSL